MVTTKQKLNKLIIAAGQREKEKEYWLKKMAGPLEKENSRFPYDYKKSAPGKQRFNTVKFNFTGELFSILSKISKNSDYTLNIILQAGVVVLLNKYTSSHDIVVGTSIYKQKNDGNFINTVLALRHQFRDFITFKELLLQVRQTLMEANDNRNYPIEVLAHQLNLPAVDKEDFPLFDVVVLLKNIHDKQYLNEIKHNMLFSFLKTNETIEGKLQYHTSLYARDSITRIIHQFTHLLQNLLFHPDMRLPDVDIIPEDEKKQLLLEFNNTGAQYPRDKTIHRLFEEQVKRTPHYIALSGHSEKSPITGYPVSITYRELNNKSNQLARTLEGKGVESRTIVGIKVERSLEMMVGIFAILKAGGAYLPIDPVYPLARIKYMLGDSQIRLLLTQAKYSETAANNFDGEVVVLEDDALYHRDGGNPGPVNRSKDPVYIIYTSGSTGQPKGVIIEHQALVNRLNWMQKAYPISPQDVILQKTPIVFDVSVWELFWWSFPGASLCLLGAGEEKSPPKIIEAIQKYRVTTIHFVPSMLNIFLEYLEKANPGHVNEFAILQQVFASGEALLPHHVERFYRLLYDTVETKLINLYGPTEATVDVSYFNCSPTALENRENIPIGKPIDNIQLYIVSREFRLQPIGVPGELCIKGVGVARGYLNNPELIREKFKIVNYKLKIKNGSGALRADLKAFGENKKVPGKIYMQPCNHAAMQPCNHVTMQLSPHYPNPPLPQFLIYLTGDMARWLRDGNIEFLGRLDDQVKIRGFRIELGEIESQLLTHNDIKEAVVLVKNDREGEPPFLCAYIVTSSKIDGLELRQYLSGKLPDYMIPSYFMKLEKIPLTVNGKVDRKALDVSGEKLDIGVEYETPADNLEKLIVNCWKEVLKQDKIGRNDHFFLLGGDSFKAMALVNKLGKLLGEHVYIVSVFENSTPARLSSYFQKHYPQAAAQIIGTVLQDHTGHNSPKLSTETIALASQLKPTPPPVPEVEPPKNPPAVFILSSRRSGSTLLRVMLAGHPGLFSPPEMDLLAFNTLDEKKSNHTSIRTLMHVNGCSLQEAQAIVQRYEEQKMTTKEFYRMIQETIVNRILVDKTASYARDMETLQRAEVYFENPLYIHLVRHPYGMIRSFEESKLDLGEKDHYLRKLSLSSRNIAELEWLMSNQNILEFLSQIPDNRHYRIRFEDLVTNPRQVAEGICQFLGLEFHPEIVEPYKEKKQRMTEIIPIMGMTGGDVKFHRHQRIEPVVADTWKKYYTAEFLGKETAQLAETFGYQLIRKNIYSSITPSEKKEYYKVSSPQKRLYILHCMEPTSPAYNLPRALVVNGELEKDKLEDVFNKLIKRHESLRTSFEIIDDHPVQIIHETVKFAIEHFELVELRDQALEIKKIIKNFARAFNLSQSPLLRVGLLKTGRENCILMIDMHHIITDGLSLQILTQEFHNKYMGAELSPLKFQYKDYSQWQNSEKQQELLKQQEEFWLKEFEGEIPLLKLPTDYPRPPIQSYEGRSLYFEIKENQTMALKSLALEEGVTIFMELFAITNILLAKLSLQEDIVVGNVVAGRRSADLERVVGMFVNTLPLRNYPAAQLSFVEFLAHLKKRTLNAFENQEYPLEDLVDKVVKNVDTSRNSLFDTAFVLQNMEIHSREISGTRVPNLKVKTHRYDRGISQFDLALTGVERRDKLCFTFEYCTKLFKKETIERFIVYFKNIAASIIATKDKKLSEIEIIPGEEKKKILYDFNDTRRPYPEDRVIQQLFQNQVTCTPDRTALIFGSKHMSYGELNEKANQLARMLRTMGIKPDSGVGILVERSIEMIMGIFAVLKAGGAYLPIDPEYPGERMEYMITDSCLELLLINKKRSRKVGFKGKVIDLDNLNTYKGNVTDLANLNTPGNLAYIIYTSGSTGSPKGVMVEHGNVIAYISAFLQIIDITSENTIIQQASFSFDTFVEEVYPILFKGGKIAIPGRYEVMDINLLSGFIAKNRVNIIDCSPLLLNELNKMDQISSSLNTFISGGDRLKGEYVNNLLKLGNLYNGYGPTETTVCATFFQGTFKDKPDYPLGKPILNYKVYILGKYNQLLPIGVQGELCISGPGVSRGYLNNPHLSESAFAANPFLEGERLYKTGDLARWLPDGNIEFLGRIDYQVKVRGFRIELGEIENQLREMQEIKETVVVINQDKMKDKYLSAYIVSEKKFRVTELRAYLSKYLPAYMIPSYFVQLEKIPLTPNGKVDRGALPGPEGINLREDVSYTFPSSVVEKKLVEIWEKVLGRDNIGINENFFMIGGDSIKSVQIISRMSRAGYKLEMKDLFQYPRISDLAPWVKKLKRIPDQSVITGTIPLTPIQENFFNCSHIDPHHYNQAVMLYSREGFDEAAIEAVFAMIQEHHDALRITYKKEEGKLLQINHGLGYSLSLQVYDFRNREDGVKALELKANEIQAGIDLEKGPLMKLGLFHLDDGDRLLIAVHHLVIDGVSWRILFEDIETLYGQYKRGEKLVLPAKTDSFKLWSEKLSAYANSKTFLKEKSYWQKIESVETPAPRILKDFDVDDNDIMNSMNVSFSLSEAETGHLLTKVNEIFRTEINDILLTALGTAMKKTFGQDRLLIALEGHGREQLLEDIDISRTVGWFTSLYPVLLDISYGADPGRQIKEIKETLRQIPKKGIGYGILKYLTEARNKKEIEFKLKPQISFNYLGQFDADVKQKSIVEIARESAGNWQSQNSKREYVLDVTGMTANNRLTMAISYHKMHFKPGTMAQLIGNFETELKHLIAFCCAQENIERTPSDFTYKGLTIEKVDGLMKEYRGIEDIYTLTPMQEGMLFHSLVDDKSSSYFEQMSYRLQGELDLELVEKSLNELFKRHDILRTAFVYKDIERPVQVVLKERVVDFYYEDITHIGERKEKENYIREFNAKDKAHPFDLSTGVLMRVSILRVDESEYEFTWSHHHILMDGWCVGIINTEFFVIYNGYLENRPYRLPVVKPYRTYIQWLEQQNKEASARYWANYLDSYEEQTVIPKTMKSEEGSRYRNEAVSVVLNKEKTDGLNQLAGRNHVTLNTVTQAVWGILLGKYNGKEDVVFGAVVSGRPSELEGVETMVGLFINTIPVRIRFEGKLKFSQLLQIVQKEALAGEPYHYYPLAEIQSGTALKQNLIDHLFIYENYPIAEQIEGYRAEKKKVNKISLKLANVEIFEQTNYDFNILLGGSKRLRITVNYNGNVYDRDFVERIVKHFSLVVDQVIENQEVAIRELAILPEEEKKRLLIDFNDTHVDYPNDKTVHEWFEEQVERTPNLTAVIDLTGQLTYRGLNEQSNRLAGLLQDKGITRDIVVGIILESSLDMTAGIIGILKAGGAYLPIDTAHPVKRILSILEENEIPVLLTRETDYDKSWLEGSGRNIVCLDRIGEALDWYPVGNPVHINQPCDLLYLITTSGSTGTPKSLMIEHRNFVNLLNFGIYETGIQFRKVLQFASIGFDPSVQEIFSPLLTGGEVYLISKDMKSDISRLFEYIQANGVNVVFWPPAFLKYVFSEPQYREEFPRSIEHICAAGEQLVITEPLRKYIRESGLRVHNFYGPAETHVVTTYAIDPAGRIDEMPCIGKPVSNTQIYILDEEKKVKPLGTIGELYIGGANVGRGYLNRPELTAEKFGPHNTLITQINRVQKTNKSFGKSRNPFSKGFLVAEGILYRTGDLARWLPDGNIEFIGRVDFQVKIRGFRVEQGEIENRLLKERGIKEAVVLEREEYGGDKYICAYFVSDREYEMSELRESLSKELPDYMIPSYFVKMEKIPLTHNGKIDRKSLPGPGLKVSESYTAPGNEIEKKLVELWSENLGRDALHVSQLQTSIGINDNFFELGGHSLKAMILVSKIHKVFDVKVPLVEIFKMPRIKELAKYIKGKSKDYYISIEPAELKEYYELSSAQKRIYILQMREMNNMSYNMPAAYLIEGKLDKEKFEESIQGIIDQHEPLRTSFEQIDAHDEPIQKIEKNIYFRIEYEKIRNEKDIKNKVNEFVKPFDISKAPLMRAALIEMSKKKYIVLFDIHHIISDGSSMEILVDDFARLYEEKNLSPLPVQYKDYVAWNNRFMGGKLAKQEIYWLRKLNGFVFTQLPITNFQSYKWIEGKQKMMLFDPWLVDGIEKFCHKHHITKFTFLITTFEMALSREINQHDITIGIPVSIRSHFDLKHLMGIFLNVVLIRTIIDDNDSFLNHLSKSKETVIEALNNQDYPYEILDYKIREKGYLNDKDLFSILFNFFPQETDKVVFTGDFEIHPYKIGDIAPKYDLTVYVYDNANGIRMNLVYKSNIYKEYSIQNLLDNFLSVIHCVLENNEIKLSEIASPTVVDADDFDMEFEKYYEGE